MAARVHVYKEPFDRSTIPDDVIVSEARSRRAAKKQRLGKKYGDSALLVKERTCKGCGVTGSTRWLRSHRCPSGLAWPRRY